MVLSYRYSNFLTCLRELWLRAPRSVIDRFAFVPRLDAVSATVQFPIEKI